MTTRLTNAISMDPPANSPRRWALAVLAACTLAVAAAANAEAATIKVSPAGSDANPGTTTAPLKTLGKALSKAVAGDTVKLAGGGYGQGPGANGEQIPATGLRVPSGVTIEGATDSGFPVSTLLGQGGGVGLRFAGNATVRNLFVGGGAGLGIGLYAKQGKQTLSNLFIITRSPASATVDGVTFNDGHGILMRGTAQTTLTAGASQANTTGSTIFLLGNGGTGVSVNEQARFTMDGGSITGGDQPNCRIGTVGIDLKDSARATVRNVVNPSNGFRNIAGVALMMHDASNAVVSNTLMSRSLPAGCRATPSVILTRRSALTMQGTTSHTGGGVATDGIGSFNVEGIALTLDHSNINVQDGRALALSGPAVVAIDDSSIGTANGTGIDAPRQVGLTINRSHIDGGIAPTGLGISADALKLRNSIVRARTGILVTGPRADLGTVFDPGNNDFHATNDTGVRVEDHVPQATVEAVGNTWRPNTQGSDAAGHYAPPLLVVSGIDPSAQGKNFDVSQFNPSPNVGIRVAAVPVGAFRLSARRLTARPGRAAIWKLVWTHPVDWKRLDQIVLRLEHHGKPVGRVLVDQETRRLRTSGSALRLVPGRSAVSRVQAGGKRVTARLALQIAKRYAGRTLVAKVAATDDAGNRQGFRPAGRVRLLDR